MANDIQKAISANPIKNGTTLVSCTLTGEYSTLETYVNNAPTISDIENKYDNRFYNGIFVQLTGNQTVIGG
jgi:hypothetical protein